MKPIQNAFARFRSLDRKFQLGIGCGGLILLCMCCLLGSALISPQSRTPSVALDASTPVRTAIPSPTTAPAATSQQTDIPASPSDMPAPTDEPISSEQTTGLIPGLQASDVTVNLEQRGFDCTSAQKPELYYLWTCTEANAQHEIRVDVYGRTLTTVDLVEVNVLQFAAPSDDLPREIMGYLSTLPYEGATPAEARTWIESELPRLQGEGDIHTLQFGGVPYRLYGIPTARVLEIGDLTDGASVSPSNTLEAPNVVVTGEATANVNIRELPSTDAPILGQVKQGERIILTGRIASNEWYKFERGWVVASAIQVTGDLSRLEVIEITLISDTTQVPPTAIVQPAPPPDGCNPNYDSCVPIALDVDCAGGDGDGPVYLEGTARVLGSDVYELDRDNNGIACD